MEQRYKLWVNQYFSGHVSSLEVELKQSVSIDYYLHFQFCNFRDDLHSKSAFVFRLSGHHRSKYTQSKTSTTQHASLHGKSVLNIYL